jgi:elongation factor Ts
MSRSELLKELRALTQAGMKDCNDALNEAGDDLQKAVDIIKTKGKNIVSSRQGKVAAEGRVAIAAMRHNVGAAMAEINCQTDFVANSPSFVKLTGNVASQLFDAAFNDKPFDPTQDPDIISARDNIISSTKENIVIRRWWVEQAISPLAGVFDYVHSNNKIGVLLTLVAPSREARNDPSFIELGNDLAMQVAAMSPLGISPDMLPPEEVERQKNIFLTQIVELNKPEAAQAKILEGKLNKWYSEVCLLEQESVVVPKTLVKKVIADLEVKLGGSIQVVTMIRCQVGEGIQQESSNLADEVAKLMQ